MQASRSNPHCRRTKHPNRELPAAAVVALQVLGHLVSGHDEGLVAVQRIRTEHPGAGVLFLSQYVDAAIFCAQRLRPGRRLRLDVACDYVPAFQLHEETPLHSRASADARRASEPSDL
jgi:hypothetical protein